MIPGLVPQPEEAQLELPKILAAYQETHAEPSGTDAEVAGCLPRLPGQG
jgi:hypothetical protein